MHKEGNWKNVLRFLDANAVHLLERQVTNFSSLANAMQKSLSQR